MYNGIINIYKEKGFTSHDVVAKLRGILKQKKIGHTGTLDPDATGVLPVCLGKGTKLCDMLTDKEKAYSVKFVLGKATDTQDISGEIINETDVSEARKEATDEHIKDVVESYIGEYDQIPPMYSAIKINGKKLYELAREGKEIERPARRIKIIKIENMVIDYPYISMDVYCSKGTYIRTLCHDIGIKLGTYACMTELERIKSGDFIKEDAKTLDEIKVLHENEELEKIIVPVEKMFDGLKKITVYEWMNKLLINGNPLFIKDLKVQELVEGEKVSVFDHTNTFIGVYTVKGNMIKPDKLFLS